MVSAVSDLSGIGLAALLVAALGVGGCAGRQHPVTQTDGAKSATSSTTAVAAEPRTDILEFDNQATVYVDVYLVGGQRQWRLGRVLPGMRTTLRVPESAVDWTVGFVQLTVIPGSQMSAQAWRDRRAIIAIAEPLTEVLSQRWTFRQPDGSPLQLYATRLTRRQ
jgi:hypothetical protein